MKEEKEINDIINKSFIVSCDKTNPDNLSIIDICKYCNIADNQNMNFTTLNKLGGKIFLLKNFNHNQTSIYKVIDNLEGKMFLYNENSSTCQSLLLIDEGIYSLFYVKKVKDNVALIQSVSEPSKYLVADIHKLIYLKAFKNFLIPISNNNSNHHDLNNINIKKNTDNQNQYINEENSSSIGLIKMKNDLLESIIHYLIIEYRTDESIQGVIYDQMYNGLNNINNRFPFEILFMGKEESVLIGTKVDLEYIHNLSIIFNYEYINNSTDTFEIELNLDYNAKMSSITSKINLDENFLLFKLSNNSFTKDNDKININTNINFNVNEVVCDFSKKILSLFISEVVQSKFGLSSLDLFSNLNFKFYYCHLKQAVFCAKIKQNDVNNDFNYINYFQEFYDYYLRSEFKNSVLAFEENEISSNRNVFYTLKFDKNFIYKKMANYISKRNCFIKVDQDLLNEDLNESQLIKLRIGILGNETSVEACFQYLSIVLSLVDNS